MTTKLMTASCLVIACAFPCIGYADIVSVSSGVTLISAPSFVGSNFNIALGLPPVVAFNEQQNVTLTKTLDLDFGGPVAAGTVVDSHFFSGNSQTVGSGPFSITFNGPVLGVVFMDGSANYAETDILGAVGTSYSESGCGNCGFEAGETATFSGNTVTFNESYSVPGDMARVITAATPEPAGYKLLLGMLGLLSILVVRRKSRVSGPAA